MKSRRSTFKGHRKAWRENSPPIRVKTLQVPRAGVAPGFRQVRKPILVTRGPTDYGTNKFL